MVVPGMQSTFEIENVCQEVFLRAFSDGARARFDGKRSYRNYLLRIARNYVIDEYRKRRRWVAMDEVAEMSENAIAESRLLAVEFNSLLIKFIKELSPTDRQYYSARYRDGLSQTEAAARIGLTRMQGRRIEAKIKQALLRHLEEKGYLGNN